MSILFILVPASLCLAALGLIAFIWTLKRNQYEDLDGAAWRILADDERED